MWVRYALYAMASFSAMQLLFKQLTRMGLTAPVILLWLFGLSALLFTGHVVLARETVAVSPAALGVVAAAALCSYVGNLYMLRSVAAAPNAGYAISIVSTHALFVVLGSLVFFQGELTLVKALGAALCVAGVVLISL